MIGVLDNKEAFFVDDLLSSLEGQVCRIAIIGQVNVGKSSFINALTQRTDLLPTGMEPRTAVLTRLHFGRSRDESGSARFNFFTAEEWENLVVKDDDIEDDTNAMSAEQGVDRDIILYSRKADEICLKPSHETLLGKSHLFKSVTSNIIESYIAETNKAPDKQNGILEDISRITKSADFYLELHPFQFPTTIIDTPGVDHPTRMRRPITWENINEADIYLVMVKASEGLTASETALLRNLHALREDRIIILINHVDLVCQTTSDWERLSEAVHEELYGEIPGAQFPVIPTSAFWGECAVKVDTIDMEKAISPALMEFASYTSNQPVEYMQLLSQPDFPALSRVFLDASGIPTASREINRLMKRADCFRTTQDAVATLLRLTYISAALRQVERDGLAKLIVHYQDDTKYKIDTIAQLRTDLALVKSKSKELNDIISNSEIKMQRTIEDGLRILERDLYNSLKIFVVAELQKIKNQTDEKMINDFFLENKNTIAIKRYTSTKIIEVYRNLKRDIFSITAETHRSFDTLVGKTLSKYFNELSQHLSLFGKRIPTFIPVSRAIEADLDAFLESSMMPGDDNSGSIASAKAALDKVFPELVSKLLFDAKSDLNHSLMQEIRELRTVSDLIGKRLVSVIENQINIIESCVKKSDDRTAEETLLLIQNAFDRASHWYNETIKISEHLKDVYYMSVNTRKIV